VLFCASQVGVYLLFPAWVFELSFKVHPRYGTACRLSYRLVVFAGMVSLYAWAASAMLSSYVVLDLSSTGWSNGILLFFGGALFSSYLISVAVLFSPAKRNANATSLSLLVAAVKASLVRFADFWYFGWDAVLSSVLLFTLLIFSLLPLLSLQSQLLFNRDFARVIAIKLRRAEFLERILS